MKFYIPFGDYSGDGHKQYCNILVSAPYMVMSSGETMPMIMAIPLSLQKLNRLFLILTILLNDFLIIKMILVLMTLKR